MEERTSLHVWPHASEISWLQSAVDEIKICCDPSDFVFAFEKCTISTTLVLPGAPQLLIAENAPLGTPSALMNTMWQISLFYKNNFWCKETMFVPLAAETVICLEK